MGEVYKARDTKLQRAVAIKILPEAVATDTERLQRFEHEARILSSLNHPNLLAIYDFGTQDGIQYLVSEFLQGQTLRDLLRNGPLTSRRAVAYATEIAHGLAAAHEKNIVHRDLKPENIFVTDEGRIKILDFGLAKLSLLEPAAAFEMTMTVKTDPGVVLGTVGYMSPEQVRGQAADARSDLFALGVILYEMVSGRRPFQGATTADTMSAILKEDPTPLADSARSIPPGLERIIAHSLEKNPQQRFQSAQDFSFNLDQLSQLSGSSPSSALATAQQKRTWPLLIAAGLLIIAVGAFWLGRYTRSSDHPNFHQLTFQRGRVLQARFSPDGETILYSAAWNGQPTDVYSTRADRPGARSLDLKGAQVLAVSSAGDLAVLTQVHPSRVFADTGTLTIMPLSGGAAHDVAENVEFADFSSDGTQLAIIRDMGQRARLEYPVGRSIYEFTGWLSHPRISPRRNLVAFVEHPGYNDTFGSLVITDTAGNRKTLAKNLSEVLDLAWSPGGDEIWFTASEENSQRSIYAVTLEGKRRLLLDVPGNLVLKDVSRDGQVLLVRENPRRELSANVAGSSRELDLSWFDWTVPDDITRDGRTFTFHEAGVGGGKDYAQFVRSIDGAQPVLLGQGDGGVFSPDGKWILAATAQSPFQILLYPIGAGEPRQITHDSINHIDQAWLPDGKGFAFVGAEPGHNTRVYVQDLTGGHPKAISAEGYGSYGAPVSYDGKYFVASCLDLRPCLVPLTGGEPLPIPNTSIADQPTQWSEDGRSLYMFRFGAVPATIDLVNMVTGKRRPVKTVAPADLAGVHGIDTIHMTRDARVCLYTYLRTFSELYLVKGIH
jgi:serine/threonine protein kinase